MVVPCSSRAGGEAERGRGLGSPEAALDEPVERERREWGRAVTRLPVEERLVHQSITAAWARGSERFRARSPGSRPLTPKPPKTSMLSCGEAGTKGYAGWICQ